MSTKTKTVINKEVALEELVKFVNSNIKKPLEADVLEESYPDVLDAIMDGFLSFDSQGKPTYKLKDPIKNEKGEVSLSEIKFTERIKPTTLRNIAKGIDFKKDPLGLQLKMVAHITDQTEAMVDNYSRYDYDAISQICTVFS